MHRLIIEGYKKLYISATDARVFIRSYVVVEYYTGYKRECARFITSAHVYDLWVRICARIFMKLFCKYLRNESFYLHEILCDGQSLSCEIKFIISFRFMHKCACKSCEHARARFIASVLVYDLCACICAWIFMKFQTYVYNILIDHHIKFHENPRYFTF